MKVIAIALSMTLASLPAAAFPAAAQDANESESAAGANAPLDRMALCKRYHSMATTLMKSRQSGADMSKMMEPTIGSKSAAILQPMVIAAYEVPRYSTPQHQTRAVQDFANEQYLSCVKAIQEVGN